jgi:hypothetical protein
LAAEGVQSDRITEKWQFDTTETGGLEVSRLPAPFASCRDIHGRSRVCTREPSQDWSNIMAAKCDLCGKGPQFGNNISHANNTTRRRWNVNLRRVYGMFVV